MLKPILPNCDFLVARDIEKKKTSFIQHISNKTFDSSIVLFNFFFFRLIQTNIVGLLALQV